MICGTTLAQQHRARSRRFGWCCGVSGAVQAAELDNGDPIYLTGIFRGRSCDILNASGSPTASTERYGNAIAQDRACDGQPERELA
jgi:hypothetical protein